MGKKNITKMITLGTGELSYESYLNIMNPFNDNFPSYEYEHGGFVFVGDCSLEVFRKQPEDIQRCVFEAIRNQCEWIRFDSDREVYIKDAIYYVKNFKSFNGVIWLFFYSE